MLAPSCEPWSQRPTWKGQCIPGAGDPQLPVASHFPTLSTLEQRPEGAMWVDKCGERLDPIDRRSHECKALGLVQALLEGP